jgi:formiminotetrahydrofolate cyclodeaminase
MDDGALRDVPLGELLDRVAARTPAPGAGSTSAVTCAVAAALVEMTAAHDRGPGATTAQRRAATLRERALELADRELTAYAPVLEAARRPAEDPERAGRLSAALANAAAPPLAVATVAAELVTLAAGCVETVPAPLLGEALAAAELADGTCRAAARLVEINLDGLPADPRLPEIAGLVRTAAEARSEAIAKAADR